MFRRWMAESGVSRTARTSGRRSLRVTSAARETRLCEKPVAMAASVFTVQGAITIPRVRNDPLDTAAARSFSACTSSASFFTSAKL